MTRAITALVALFAVKLQAPRPLSRARTNADAAEQKKLGPCPISNHLKDLPYTSTFEMSPDAQLVGYLSQHTTHAILQAKPEIDALMAK